MILVGFFVSLIALAIIVAFIVFAIMKKNRHERMGERRMGERRTGERRMGEGHTNK
jgi:hypothetical protein